MTNTSQVKVGVDLNNEPCSSSSRQYIGSSFNRRISDFPQKTFGVPLETLVEHSSRQVPAIVQIICEFLLSHGLEQEGIFRTNGSSSTIARLRTSYECCGEVCLEDKADVASAASVLKQFLRELPDPVIPHALHWTFIKHQEETQLDVASCVEGLRMLVNRLPVYNHHLLAYLIAFLVRVAQNQHANRMGPAALGIVFGANLFRVLDGVQAVAVHALHEQTIANEIVTKFITHHTAIFGSSNHIQTSQPLRRDQSLSCQTDELSSSSSSSSSSTSSSDQVDERSHERLVEMTICDTVTEHIFGENEQLCGLRSGLLQLNTQDNIESPQCLTVNRDSRMLRSSSEERPVVNTLEPGSSVRRICSHGDVSGLVADSSSDQPPTATLDVYETKSKKQRSNDSDEEDKKCSGVKQKQRKSNPTASLHHALVPLNMNLLQEVEPEPSVAPVTDQQDWYKHDDNDIHEVQRRLERVQPRGLYSKQRRSGTKMVHKSRSWDEANRSFVDPDSLKENNISKQHKYHRVRSMTVDEISPDVDLSPSGFLHLQIPGEGDVKCDSKQPAQTPSPVSARKDSIPALDLTTLHQYKEGGDPIPTIQASATVWSFPPLSPCNDDVMPSPRSSSQSMTRAHLDPNIPPSPPVEQEPYLAGGLKDDVEALATSKQLTKKIQSMKRKIKQYEEHFEEEHGYKPSHSEKMGRSDIKLFMTDLMKARKELKQLRMLMPSLSMADLGSRTPGSLVRSMSDPKPVSEAAFTKACLAPRSASDDTPTLEESLEDILQRLAEKRRHTNRPDLLEDMTTDQVVAEKLAMQKALLQFENTHGRPIVKADKDVMKPLYDRYRTVKRLVAKANSPKTKDALTDLQPIPEHVTMEFVQTAESKQDAECKSADSQQLQQNDDMAGSPGSNFHELTLPQLLSEQRLAREEKHRLRRLLREYEEEFQENTGRRITRQDRAPLEPTYAEYKQVKARLRLLDALVSKHRHHYTI